MRFMLPAAPYFTRQLSFKNFCLKIKPGLIMSHASEEPKDWRRKVKKNQLIGVLRLVLAIATVVGMVLADPVYWHIYNYVTLIFCVLGAKELLIQK
jgi:hypothetical protein